MSCVCIGGISTHDRLRSLAIHVFVIALGIKTLYPYEEGVKSFSIRVRIGGKEVLVCVGF